MAAPIVETIWLVNGFKCHIVMAGPFAVTAPSSLQNLMKSSSRRFDGKSRSLDDRDYRSHNYFGSQSHSPFWDKVPSGETSLNRTARIPMTM